MGDNKSALSFGPVVEGQTIGDKFSAGADRNDLPWSEVSFHYSDNPYPEEPAPTVDTCQSCYEADPDIPHINGCELKDIHLRVNVEDSRLDCKCGSWGHQCEDEIHDCPTGCIRIR
jgi:hypothetical protein